MRGTCATADEAYHLGAAPAAESYLNIAKHHRGGEAGRRRCRAPGLRISVGERRFRAGLRRCGADLRRAARGRRFAPWDRKAPPRPPWRRSACRWLPATTARTNRRSGCRPKPQRVGFPLIIKASAGGGGKGMQVVEVRRARWRRRSNRRSGWRAPHSATIGCCSSDTSPMARHVEVQVFADTHGNTVSLFDRDCSVQRRHQKIIEEAPAPGLRGEVRAAMARRRSKRRGRWATCGAGTVEFLVDEAAELLLHGNEHPPAGGAPGDRN